MSPSLRALWCSFHDLNFKRCKHLAARFADFYSRVQSVMPSSPSLLARHQDCEGLMDIIKPIDNSEGHLRRPRPVQLEHNMTDTIERSEDGLL